MNLNLSTDTEAQQNVIKNLRTNEQGIRVVFTKKDGTERSMLCTLFEAKIPQDKHPKTETTSSNTSGTTVRVFDLEKSEWRSFRWDSVTSMEI
jgi:hypothetical protein